MSTTTFWLPGPPVKEFHQVFNTNFKILLLLKLLFNIPVP